MTVRPKTITLIGFLTLAAALLAIAFFPPAAPPAAAAIQPRLQQAIQANPTGTVRVMVQKADRSDRAARAIEALGGEIIHDLDLIHMIAAEMPAAAAAELAQNPAVRRVALDGAVERSGKPGGGGGGKGKDSGTSPTDPANTYLETLGVPQVWAMGYRGEGIGVAVIDSGIATDRDFTTEPGKPFTLIVKQVSFSTNSFATADATGHGTHVAGIIGGNGDASAGRYVGIAPKADIINLKISDDMGMAYESDAVAAMQWVYENKDHYNIRVVNISLNSTVPSSYHDSPLNAAAEILWFNGLVVVVSAGNSGTGSQIDTISAAPANDPFLITVGATDESGTARKQDDSIPTFSASGWTLDYFSKPDIFAPGKNIVSVLASSSHWKFDYPDRVTSDQEYFRASGTSMSAPMVSGAAALLLQAEPGLTPDQVKYRLRFASTAIQGYPYLDVYKALTTPTTASANTGLVASHLLSTGSEPIVWSSVAWNSVAWNSVAWNSVAWNSVAWNSVAWNSVAWNE